MSFTPEDGQILPGIVYDEGKPEDWQNVQPGWGQQPSVPMTVAWGGADKEFDVEIVDAPVVTERVDKRDLPPASNHGPRH